MQMSMEFYRNIVNYYDDIFPPNPLQVSFLKEMKPAGTKMLDIGCATGSLAAGLAHEGYELTGIDLDKNFIRKAKKKYRDKQVKLSFLPANMLELSGSFPPSGFGMVTCVGNTLVHLHDQWEIRKFFHEVYAILANTGIIVFQIINYSRILRKHIKNLPEIDNETVNFKRFYEEEGSRIQFRTILTSKKEGFTSEQSVYLFPLQKTEAEGLLEDAGFTNISCYGSFKKEPFDADNSYALVMTAQKA